MTIGYNLLGSNGRLGNQMFQYAALRGIARINDYVYHLEHSRTHNSWFSNPNFDNNWKLWNRIKTFDKKKLVQYYENQTYVKTRRM